MVGPNCNACFLLISPQFGRQQKVQSYGGDARICLAFHGTHEDNINSIMDNNFSMEKVGASTGNLGWFGRGIYFGRRAYTALGYNVGRRMLLALIVVGKNSTFMCPPPDSSDNPYHGQPCVANHDSHLSPTGRELVVFDPKQILPCFCLHLSTSEYGKWSRSDYYGREAHPDCGLLGGISD